MKVMLTKTFMVNIALVIVFVALRVFSQDSEIITSLFDEVSEDEFMDQGWVDNLWELIERPLPINTASEAELLKIPFIDSRLARKIVLYRKKVREIKDLEELLFIEGMSTELFEAIRPMLTVASPGISPRLTYRIRSRMEMPLKVGYQKKVYHHPVYLQQRILFQANKWISGGILWEKDPGEANYFDYGSFYIQYQQPQKKYSMLLGDFYQRYGAGLVLNSPYGNPFSIHSLPLFTDFADLATGNKSSIESGGLRGLSLSYPFRPQKIIHLFYSHNYLDGNLTADRRYFTSWYTTGFHRTEKEMENKRNVSEKLVGVSLITHFEELYLQMSFVYQHFEPFYQKFPQGMSYYSMAYLKKGEKFQPGGEYVLFAQKFPAFHQNWFYQNRQIKFNWIGYYYHPQYFAFHGRALGSMSGIPANQLGCAVIMNYRVVSNFYIGGYMHFYRRVQLTDEVHVVKRDYLLEIGCRFSGRQHLRLKFQKNYRPFNTSDTGNGEKSRTVIHVDYNFQNARGLEVKNFMKLSWAQPLDKTNRFYGIALGHQISWKNKYAKITFRWSEFDVPDYELRLYESEPDVSHIYRSLLLNERGAKFLVLVQLNAHKKLEFDVKYEQRLYPDLKTVGSGLDAYPSSQIREIRVSLLGRI